MNIQSTINHCINLSYYDLEDFAGENYKKVYAHLTKSYEASKVNTVLIGTIFTCIAANGKFSDAESKFIMSFVGGYSDEEAFKVAGEFYNDDAQFMVRDIVKMFPSDIKDAFISMCIAVLAVDKRVDDYEKCFLNRII